MKHYSLWCFVHLKSSKQLTLQHEQQILIGTRTELETGLKRRLSFEQKDVVFITYSSSNHFPELRAALWILRRINSYNRIIVFDVGLRPDQVSTLLVQKFQRFGTGPSEGLATTLKLNENHIWIVLKIEEMRDLLKKKTQNTRKSERQTKKKERER